MHAGRYASEMDCTCARRSLAVRRPRPLAFALAFSFLWLSTDPSFRRAALHGGCFLSTGTPPLRLRVRATSLSLRPSTSGINLNRSNLVRRFSKDGRFFSGFASMRSGQFAPSLSIGQSEKGSDSMCDQSCVFKIVIFFRVLRVSTVAQVFTFRSVRRRS